MGPATPCRRAGLKTRKWRVLLEDAADARYVPTGHLVFLRQGTLMAVPFDLDRLEIIGQPVPAVANVMQALNTMHSYNTAAGQFSISDSGSLIYVTGGIVPDMKNSLCGWIREEWRSRSPHSRLLLSARLSPDGQRIAYVSMGENGGLGL